ncbi:integrase core domain-containing protein, partial [Cereibacter azotoformans]
GQHLPFSPETRASRWVQPPGRATPVLRLNPAANLPDGFGQLGCRSSASAQYASQTYRDALQAAGLRGSMSSVGNPYHNAQAESFMKTLKVEEVYRAGYETFADVAARLPVFIEQVYSSRRLHSALRYRTPEEFETLFARKAA